MNFVYCFKLELVKHRRTFFGVALIILLGVLGPAVGGVALGYWDWTLGLSGAVAMMVCGIPLLAAVFGSMTGAALRREPEREAEAPLPVHPLVRVSSAFGVGLSYSVLLIVAFPAFFAFDEVFNYAYQSPMFQQIFGPLFWWLTLGTLHVYVLSFLLAYWLKQPVLGSGLALIVGVLETLFPIEYLVQYNQKLMDYGFSYLDGPVLSVDRTPFIWYLAMGLLLSILAVGYLAGKIEKGKILGYPRSAAIGCALALSLILAGAHMYFWNSRFQRQYDQYISAQRPVR